MRTRRHVLKEVAGAAVLWRLGFASPRCWGDERTGADPDWLAEVRKSPAAPADGWPALPPLVPGQPDASFADAATRLEHLKTIRNAWHQAMGWDASAVRPPLNLRELKVDEVEGCRRLLVRYDSETDWPVEAYILFPPQQFAGRRPAVIALHSTNSVTIDGTAGLVDTGGDRRLGVELAKRGFVVVCPRCFLWQSVKNFNEAMDKFRMRHPGKVGMYQMLCDAVRAVDVAQAMKEVDPKRIGACGHSLGAKEAIYLAAFDERIKAAVAHDGGVGRPFSNWDADWYLGKGFPKELDHHQLLALIAPRPFLIGAAGQGPGAADGDRTWGYVEAVCAKITDWRRIGVYNHREGHRLTDTMISRLIEWMERYV